MTAAWWVVQAFDAGFALGVGLIAALEWPWDFRGRRRAVTLKRERRWWED